MTTDTDTGTQLLDCGHLPTPTAGPGTGYAATRDGRRLCYGCADSETAQHVAQCAPGDRVALYVSTDGRNITTWTGGVLMRVAQWGSVHPWSRGSWSGERRYLTAVDVDGRVWSGTGAHGMFATLRLSKRTR